jgi:hypothetical protein
MPDAIFSDQKSQFGLIFVGLAMEDVGIFCGHCAQEKSGNPVSPPFHDYVLCFLCSYVHNPKATFNQITHHQGDKMRL